MKDYFGYKDKVCVVTGAASGIGRSTVDLLLDMGAVVYAIDIKDIEIPGVKNFIAADLNSKDAIDMAFEEIPKQIDCFFGVAGVSGVKTNFYTTFTVNYIANKYITETYLKKRMDRGGSIAFVTSTAGLHWEKYSNEFYNFTVARTWTDMINALHNQAKETTLGLLAYPFSKRALNYYMAEQSVELSRRGIRVNALLPGSTETGMIEEFSMAAGGEKELIDQTGVMGRIANPDEMAEALVYLNSDMARFITGLPLVLDGGAHTMVKLKLRKDRMKKPVGLKIFNTDFFQNILKKRLGVAETPVVAENLTMGIDPVEVVNTSIPSAPVVNTIMEGSNRTEHQTIHQHYDPLDDDPTEVDLSDYKDCKDIEDIYEEGKDELVIEPLKNKDYFEEDTEVLEEVYEEDTEVLEEEKEQETEILEL